jgi:hypothetical protein
MILKLAVGTSTPGPTWAGSDLNIPPVLRQPLAAPDAPGNALADEIEGSSDGESLGERGSDGIIKYFAEPMELLPAITFWQMGSLAKISIADLRTAVAPIVVGDIVIYVLRWRISVLALGDDEATALGIEVRTIRLLVITAATLLVATTVCIAGTVGWVGLIVPHAARMVWGLDPSRSQLGTGLLGALFFLLVDDVCALSGNGRVAVGVNRSTEIRVQRC